MTVYGVVLKGNAVDLKNKQKPFYIKGKGRGEVIDKAHEKCNGKPLCVHWVWAITDENYDKYAFAEGTIRERK